MTTTNVASGIGAGIGCAKDHITNRLYFVEYALGTLKRVNLYPPYSVDTIATGFTHPEDVELDLPNNLAYVTTRDDAGTTGALWKVDISTGTKNLVTFNLGSPQQLVLDLANNCAYVVGYDDGRLRRIDLTTGAKIPLFKNLDHPVGLAITTDKKFAYVSEQGGSPCVSKVDLEVGTKIDLTIKEDDLITPSTFTSPFFLAWTDYTENSLFVVERDPANKVSRVDLGEVPVRYDVVTGLPFRPSGIAVQSAGASIYVTTDAEIVKVELLNFDLTNPDIIFLGVGHVPYGEIGRDPSNQDEYGYATTNPGYFFHVTRAPFGGTLNFFGNLEKFIKMGATHYEVLVSKKGGPFEPLSLAWNMYKWNNVTFEHDLVPVAPDATEPNKYIIPVEADNLHHPELWYPPFLFMRWPSGENGIYIFKVKLYDAAGNEIPGLLEDLNNLVLRVDNTPPTAQISKILQQPGNNEITACEIVSTGDNNFKFEITAYDYEGNLRSYGLSALTADNESYPVGSESHAHDTSPWYGVTNKKIPTSQIWCARRRCAHTFWLRVWSKTINGYNHIHHRSYHKSITIDLEPCIIVIPIPGGPVPPLP